MKDKYYALGVGLCLITLGVLIRLLPHPANFAPITAIAIFGGSVLPKKIAPWVPLAAIVVSDATIGFYALMPLIWACYLVIALASRRWLRQHSLAKIAIFSVSASVFFYLLSNFGVWLTSGMYAHSLARLASCYSLALPFFRNTLLSDAFYSASLFGLYALAMHWLELKQRAGSLPSRV